MSLSPREHCLPNKSGTLGCLARLSAFRHCRCGFPQSSMFIFKAFLPTNILPCPVWLFTVLFREPAATRSLVLGRTDTASALLQAPCVLCRFPLFPRISSSFLVPIFSYIDCPTCIFHSTHLGNT
jgi:hypothetical protein